MSSVGTTNEAFRDLWVRKTLAKIPSGWRILDAGAGEMRYRNDCKHLQYVAQDNAVYNGKGNDRGLQTQHWDATRCDIVCDITAIPVADGSFDACLCTEVLEHVLRPSEALAELNRILRIDGLLILTAPFCSLTHFAPYHYSTGFNRYWYERELSLLGFEIQEIITNGNYFEFIAQEVRRISDIARRYAKSRVPWWHRFAEKLTLITLNRLSLSGAASNELLCFGWHVVARKRPAEVHKS